MQYWSVDICSLLEHISSGYDSKPWGVNNISISQTNLPVEPPPPSVGWSTGAALRSQVVVPVNCGEFVSIVGRETITGVTRVTSHPDTVVLVFTVNSSKGDR